VLPAAVITGHAATAIGTSDAASQGVVEGVALQDIALLRPGEALETVPGLVVTQHSGDGKANQYFLRGYNLDHGTDLAIFVDGVPANMPTNAHGQGYSDVNFLIPELVDHIAYAKGPYFAQFGDFAAAGAVQIHYRDRLDAPLASLVLGSFGYVRALLVGSTSVAPSATSATPAAALPGTPDTASDSGPAALHVLGALELLRENGPWTTP
jgi:outer membrane cobalamin receptor